MYVHLLLLMCQAKAKLIIKSKLIWQLPNRTRNTLIIFNT